MLRAPNLIPDYLTIENCEIKATNYTSDACLWITNTGGSITGGQAMAGLVVRGCDLLGGSPITVSLNAGLLIENNHFRLDGRTGTPGRVLNWGGSNGATGWTGTIRNNTFDDLMTTNVTATGTYGLTAINVTLASGTGTVEIYNNMICGFNFKSATAGDYLYRAIYMNFTGPGAATSVMRLLQ